MPVKFVKKALRSGKRFVKKRYGIGKKRTLNVSALANDVAKMAMMINAEKKAYNAPLELRNLGQCNANSTGALIYDITPTGIIQGVTVNTRNGNSIKLSSALYQFQLAQLPAATIANKVIIEFWLNKGTYQTEATAMNQLFLPAQWSSVIDANSARSQDYFGDFRLLRRVVKTIPCDNTASESTVRTFTIPFKFNKGQGHHIRFSNNTGNLTDVANGQIFMTMRAEQGNANSFTASTLDIPYTAVNTGLRVRAAYRIWFYDN